MKRLIIICSLFTCVTTNIFAAAAEAQDVLEEKFCLHCCETEGTLSLCPHHDTHTLTCLKHAPAFFSRKECCECKRPLKRKTDLPPEFQNIIDEEKRIVDVLELEKKIETERINPIQAHCDILDSEISNAMNLLIIKPKQKIEHEQTKEALKKKKKIQQQWEIVVAILGYHRAWQAMLKEPEDQECAEKIDILLKQLPDYQTQEDVHLVGNNTDRFEKFYNTLVQSMEYSEGHPQDILPDVPKIASNPMNSL